MPNLRKMPDDSGDISKYIPGLKRLGMILFAVKNLRSVTDFLEWNQILQDGKEGTILFLNEGFTYGKSAWDMICCLHNPFVFCKLCRKERGGVLWQRTDLLRGCSI